LACYPIGWLDRSLLPTLAHPDGTIITDLHLRFLTSGSRQWAPVFRELDRSCTMRTQIIISSADVEKLKQKARKQKKDSGTPHHEALD
jgi:hypothetical protein